MTKDSDIENGTSPPPSSTFQQHDPTETTIPQATYASGISGASKRKIKKEGSVGVTNSRTKTMTSGGSSSQSQSETNALIKYSSLFLLVAQMVGLVLLMRYSRMKGEKKSGGGEGDLYISSTAVFMMEMMKFVICCVVVFFQSGSSITGLISALQKHVWESPYEVLKLCVPSLLYTIQNNLLYLALTNLDAATYQVCYQLKILTTALFSAVLLKRQFSPLKWSSLVILTIGVAIVQHSGSSDSTSSGQQPSEQSNNRVVGLIAVLCAACTSGFSGVYFEKILKGSTTSLWLRNIQMGLPSIIIAYITVYVHDGSTVAAKGFFFGYSPLVWTVVTIQAAGGLIVAVVVKYADNVLKVFATSFSIIISCIISAFVFDFRANASFMMGTLLVVSATVMYSMPAGRPMRRRRKKKRGTTVLPMSTSDGMKVI